MADYIDKCEDERDHESERRYLKRDDESWKYDYLNPASMALADLRDKAFYSEDDTIPEELATTTIALLEGLIAHLRSQHYRTKSEPPPKPDDEFLTPEQALEHYPGKKQQWLFRKTKGKPFKNQEGARHQIREEGFPRLDEVIVLSDHKPERGFGKIYKRPGSPYWYIGWSVGGKFHRRSTRSNKQGLRGFVWVSSDGKTV